MPKKIANLAELNALLAHQPWLVTSDHISSLVRGSDSWSVTELVSAIVILCTFHAHSTICWGLGIEPEIDLGLDVKSCATRKGSGSRIAVERKSDDESSAEDSKKTRYAEDVLKDRLMADLDKLMGETHTEGDKDVYEDAGASSLAVDSSSVHDEDSAQFCGHPLSYRDFNTTTDRVLKTQVCLQFRYASPVIPNIYSTTTPAVVFVL